MTILPTRIPVIHPQPHVTHEVTNQAPRLVDYDVSADPALLDGLEREGAGWATDDVRRLGVLAGSAHLQELADTANRQVPELRTFDRLGHRIDEVTYHPAYHELVELALANGLGGSAWADDRAGAHVAYYAKHLIWGHTDQGHMCPTSMTHAVVPALREEPALAAVYEPLIVSRTYDPQLRPVSLKVGMTAGMSMTEKQGGSDLRTNATVAVPTEQDGVYRLTGHKWFTSAPMCDIFLTLAQTEVGPTCFLVPRVLDDGTRNAFRIQRIKDKLGNRSNASSEPEFDGAVAYRVGEEGRGIQVILKMVMSTRLDVISQSAALMRVGLVHAHNHAVQRAAFGHRLIDQPLMRNVLADLALDSEAATTFTMRCAGAYDRAFRGDRDAAYLLRIATAVGKYWVAKRTAPFAAEALECLGGNGYAEESILPRYYREAPLNSIWEGASNVNCLDVLRAARREPDSVEALRAELDLARGAHRVLDTAIDNLHDDLGNLEAAETRARLLVERMALVLQGSLLARFSPNAVSDAFIASRLGGRWGHAYGTLSASTDFSAILDRAIPTERS